MFAPKSEDLKPYRTIRYSGKQLAAADIADRCVADPATITYHELWSH